jgi:hypothetical protein
MNDPMRDRVAPALDVGILAARLEMGEVDDGREIARLAQRACGVREQARLADPACTEHVDEATRAQRGLERPVGRALDVGEPIRLHRTADHEKLCRLDDLRHARRL